MNMALTQGSSLSSLPLSLDPLALLSGGCPRRMGPHRAKGQRDCSRLNQHPQPTIREPLAVKTTPSNQAMPEAEGKAGSSTPLQHQARLHGHKTASTGITLHHPQNLLSSQFTCGNTRHTAKQNVQRLPIWQTTNLYSTCTENSNCPSLIIHLYHGNQPNAFQGVPHSDFPKEKKNATKTASMKLEWDQTTFPSDLWGALRVDGVTGATQPIGDPTGTAHHYPAVCPRCSGRPAVLALTSSRGTARLP